MKAMSDDQLADVVVDLGMDEQEAEFTPSESWRASFEKQATRGILEKLHRIARARLGAYVGGVHNVSDADVEDVVIAALGDTWSGTLAWDPTAKPLYAHLKDAIKYRVRNGAKLARKTRKHDPIEEDERGETLTSSIAAGAIAPVVETRDRRDEHLGKAADHTIEALRPLAARDAEVTSLLDALAKRVTERDDLLEETGM